MLSQLQTESHIWEFAVAMKGSVKLVKVKKLKASRRLETGRSHKDYIFKKGKN